MNGELNKSGGVRGEDVEPVIEVKHLGSSVIQLMTGLSNDSTYHGNFRIRFDFFRGELDGSEALPVQHVSVERKEVRRGVSPRCNNRW